MSLAVFIAAALASFLSGWIMIKVAITDTPVARSSHILPTPTAGGVAIFIAIVSLFGLSHAGGASVFGADPIGLGHESFVLILGCLGLIGGIGLLDDIYNIGVKVKLIFMIFAAVISAAYLGPIKSLPIGAAAAGLPLWLGYGGAALWIFTVINVVNFTDGANGMMGLNMGAAAIAMLALILLSTGSLAFWLNGGLNAGLSGAPITAAWSAALLAGLLGFLPFNARHKARLFAGDAGALITGYLYAVIVLIAVIEMPETGVLYLGPLFILPLMTEVFLTLQRRVRAGHNPFVAHNDHVFQRLIRSGQSHLRVSAVYLGATLCVCLAGLLAEHFHIARSPAFLIAASVIAALIYYRQLRKTALDLREE